MKRTTERINSVDLWQFGDPSAELWTYSLSGKTRFTYDGQFFLPGDGSVRSPFLRTPITISGNVVPYIESFEIDSSDDSPDDPLGRYTSIIVGSSGRRVPFLEDYKVPSTTVDPVPVLTWIDIVLFTNTRRPRLGDHYYRDFEVDYKIDSKLGLLVRSRLNTLGMGYSSVEPDDLVRPTFLEQSDPRFSALVGTDGSPSLSNPFVTDSDPRLLGGFPQHGVAAMVDGVVVVPSAIVVAASNIFLTLQFAPAGKIYCDPAEIVDGVSFTIRSDDPGDAGNILWGFA